jgi:hypothetical protein
MTADELSTERRDASETPVARGPAEWIWRAARVDLRAGRPPSGIRLVLATVGSVIVSLALDVLAVHVATTQFPATRHFSHFRPADYGTLTVVGVLLAAGGWAVLVRLSSAARWLYFRLAVVATLVLWIPDAILLALGEPPAGVLTLMVMHLLIALVTYNLLVRIAPAGPPAAVGEPGWRPQGTAIRLPERLVRRIWSAMAMLVGLELVLGVVVIVSVPFRRPAAILPSRGIWVYAAHGAVGLALGVGAMGVLVLSTAADRIGRIGAVTGAIGVMLGVAGGVCATFQQTRLVGMGVMLVGVVLAGAGYLAPSLEAMGKAEAARAEAARAEAARSEAARAEAARIEAAGGAPGAGHSHHKVSGNGHAPIPPR